jgi:hypothetical protein
MSTNHRKFNTEKTKLKMRKPKSREHTQHIKDSWVIRKLNKST